VECSSCTVPDAPGGICPHKLNTWYSGECDAIHYLISATASRAPASLCSFLLARRPDTQTPSLWTSLTSALPALVPSLSCWGCWRSQAWLRRWRCWSCTANREGGRGEG
jgi:hypothetical protein